VRHAQLRSIEARGVGCSGCVSIEPKL
jgi:hypothetical protein